MAGEVTGAIPKPVLRGLHQATIKRNLIVATGLVVLTVTAMKFLYNDPRKQKYAEYYKTYDEKKVLTRMVEGGHLHSISSVDEI